MYREMPDGSIRVDVFTRDMPFVGDGVRGISIRDAAEHVHIHHYPGLSKTFEPTDNSGNVTPVFNYEGWRITIEDENNNPCNSSEQIYRQVFLVARKQGEGPDDRRRTIALLIEGRRQENGRSPALRQTIFTYLGDHLVNPTPYHERRD